MQFDKTIPDPWPEDLYWVDLYDHYPMLIRYASFYSDDFKSRLDTVHMWYYGKHASMDATPENYTDIVKLLLTHMEAYEFLQ